MIGVDVKATPVFNVDYEKFVRHHGYVIGQPKGITSSSLFLIMASTFVFEAGQNNEVLSYTEEQPECYHFYLVVVISSIVPFAGNVTSRNEDVDDLLEGISVNELFDDGI